MGVGKSRWHLICIVVTRAMCLTVHPAGCFRQTKRATPRATLLEREHSGAVTNASGAAVTAGTSPPVTKQHSKVRSCSRPPWRGRYIFPNSFLKKQHAHATPLASRRRPELPHHPQGTQWGPTLRRES